MSHLKKRKNNDGKLSPETPKRQRTVANDECTILSRVALERKLLFLNEACMNGNLTLVKICIEHGVSAMQPDRQNRIAYHQACQFGHLEVVQYLIESGKVELNLGNDSGRNCLFLACMGASEEVVEFLLEQEGLEIEKADHWGTTPFGESCYIGNPEVVKLFLARTDIDLNHKDEEGIMPLEIACTHGNPEVVKLLLQNEDILKEHEPLLQHHLIGALTANSQRHLEVAYELCSIYNAAPVEILAEYAPEFESEI
eukprot:CAMPEP_0206187998 /NCGR_PEP_ID=MMETSP0166-20121206/3332_1 /ASSEMBLY_ACC=CAM_ASM_000260 /TAXON_ID=95228 /ORGANISM="Vannella robusta, Strain DIVA3 518/3/11/1/6" /LENGTH=254 /DNA_ID=CAMNT_0053603681 /DNA_START=831 /DNA_END=1592 /DNA_ORIENTATION=+